jgi:hypothetical protein
LLIKDIDFYWDNQCRQAIDILKEKLSSSLVLAGPNWSLLFHVSIDASDSAIGFLLVQKENLLTYVIYFIRKNLSPFELNYTVTEKEFLAMVYAINKFKHYITEYEVFIHTDHFAIKYLMNKPIANGRITKWFLLQQKFHNHCRSAR